MKGRNSGASGGFAAKLQPLGARLAAAGADASGLLNELRAGNGRLEVLEPKALIQGEDERMRRPRFLLSGWACRFTQFADGRRQVFDLILPGEGIGVCLRPRPLALTSVAALTRVELVDAPPSVRPGAPPPGPELSRALEIMADLDELRLLGQVARLGRMTAFERLTHLLLQLHDRLAVIGAAENGRFALPLTQELLADLLGLSTVHLNRTLQELRRQHLIETERGVVRLPDRTALARLLPAPPPGAARLTP